MNPPREIQDKVLVLIKSQKGPVGELATLVYDLAKIVGDQAVEIENFKRRMNELGASE